MKTLRKIVLIGFFSVLPLTPTYADEQSDNQARQIEQNIINQRNTTIRQLQEEQMREGNIKQLEDDKKGEKITIKPEEVTQENKNCNKIKSIKLEGMKKFSDKTVKQITNQFSEKCLTNENITYILKEITNHYISHGYMTSRAVIGPQNFANGNLVITVVEGKLDKIKYNEKSKHKSWFTRFKNSSEIWAAFPSSSGEILNLRDIEQGLEQINRLPNNNATLSISASDKPEYSNIAINNSNRYIPVRASLSRDNLGQSSSGERRDRVTAELGSLLGLNEYIYVTYNENADKSPLHSNSSWYSSINLPWRYWNFSYNNLRSTYTSTIVGTNVNIPTNGITENNEFRLDRVVFRNQKHKLQLSAGLTLRNTESFIIDTKNETGSRKLSVGSFSIGDNYHHKMGILNWKLAYDLGINSFGAKKNGETRNTTTTPDRERAQFKKYKMNLNYFQNFTLLKQSFNFNSTLNAQITKVPLYSSDQLAIGDAYSVRGFKERSAFGDSGFYWHNDLNWNLPSNLIPGENAVSKSLKFLLRNTQSFVGYDIGKVRRVGGKLIDQGSGEAYLSGYALGLKQYRKNFNYSFTYSKTLHVPVFMQIMNIPSKEVYVQVG